MRPAARVFAGRSATARPASAPSSSAAIAISAASGLRVMRRLLPSSPRVHEVDAVPAGRDRAGRVALELVALGAGQVLEADRRGAAVGARAAVAGQPGGDGGAVLELDVAALVQDHLERRLP